MLFIQPYTVGIDDVWPGKGNWRDGANVRDSDRDPASRGKHSRDDL